MTHKTETPYTVLVVDDEQNLRESLTEYLSLDGFVCTGCAEGEAALELLCSQPFDAVVLDLRLPRMDGLAVLKEIHDGGQRVPVVMISAHGDIQDAVTAMKLGAVDYLVKPFDPAELVIRLVKAIDGRRLQNMADLGRRLAEQTEVAWRSASPAMRTVYNLIERAAPAQSTILVTGESGTGKEVIARDIHRLSGRSAAQFVPVNVGALPESLLESELFGYEKGAFTGAEGRKPGLFELASGGTLFLDELGEMPLSMQVKLLRVLQERTVMRLGGTRPVPVDVRIIAATNRNLEDAVRNKTFREDLYFRIHVIAVHLPPLRDRTDDIAPLAGFFLSKLSRDTGKKITGLSVEALELLKSYTFPGNIRELENSIERAVILADGPLLEKHDFFFPVLHFNEPELEPELPAGMETVPEKPVPTSIRDAEKQAISAALERNGGHREKTALDLGITRRTLLNKMREFGLEW